MVIMTLLVVINGDIDVIWGDIDVTWGGANSDIILSMGCQHSCYNSDPLRVLQPPPL